MLLSVQLVEVMKESTIQTVTLMRLFWQKADVLKNIILESSNGTKEKDGTPLARAFCADAD